MADPDHPTAALLVDGGQGGEGGAGYLYAEPSLSDATHSYPAQDCPPTGKPNSNSGVWLTKGLFQGYGTQHCHAVIVGTAAELSLRDCYFVIGQTDAPPQWGVVPPPADLVQARRELGLREVLAGELHRRGLHPSILKA